jgi:hypothetical protein
MSESEQHKYTDIELLYAATGRCRCGAGLAYPLDHEQAFKLRAWVCSAVLKGEVDPPADRRLPFGIEGAPKGDHDAFDWAMYKVREETSIRNEGGCTTRPPGTVAKTVGRAICPKCKREWESAPYVACGGGHHWFPGDCPGCGYGVGGHGSHSSADGDPIDTRYRDVVVGSE